MLLTSLVRAAEDSHGAAEGLSPIAVGAVTLALLLVLLVGVLMFGKGREHS